MSVKKVKFQKGRVEVKDVKQVKIEKDRIAYIREPSDSVVIRNFPLWLTFNWWLCLILSDR